MTRNTRLTLVGIGIVAILGALLLLSIPVEAHHQTRLEDAIEEWQEADERVLVSYVAVLESEGDPHAFSEYQSQLSDALIVMDQITVDECYQPWYTAARSRFELLSEAIRLTRLGQPRYAPALEQAAVGLNPLIIYYFTQAIEVCTDAGRYSAEREAARAERFRQEHPDVFDTAGQSPSPAPSQGL